MENAQREPCKKKRLGDFEIIRLLGRGGMGIVYEARQVSLNRKVALKVLGTSLGMTSKAVVRFRREAEADTRAFLYWEWEWSRMFLDKLNQNPTWPPWIPVRDEDEVKSTTKGSAVGGIV